MSSEYFVAIEQELRDVTRASSPRYADFYNIFQYHLGWTDANGNPARADTGKRLRPLLCLWSCEAAGGDWRKALPAAAALELIHNFSLLHDDIEDQSEERRGRKTVWNVWGLAQAVNAGDAMFVLAHLALDKLGANISLDRYSEIHRAFDAATLKLTHGQYLDIGYEGATGVTLEQYFEMVRGKTAALIAVSCEIGARLATADERIIRAFVDYGENAGIAFQIADDVLGLWGDPEVTGKSARTDLLSRKKSYPVLAAMYSIKGEELRALYEKREWSEPDIQHIEKIFMETSVREQAIREAKSYAQRGLSALESSGLHNEAVTRLKNLVHEMVDREK
ncbi:MAG TPA: polyprenyl synthetase family protein [Anaerolineae bacterium]|nr:polyprenyl synthetase family protein [Anaerolineae bacterium]